MHGSLKRTWFLPTALVLSALILSACANGQEAQNKLVPSGNQLPTAVTTTIGQTAVSVCSQPATRKALADFFWRQEMVATGSVMPPLTASQIILVQQCVEELYKESGYNTSGMAAGGTGNNNCKVGDDCTAAKCNQACTNGGGTCCTLLPALAPSL